MKRSFLIIALVLLGAPKHSFGGERGFHPPIVLPPFMKPKPIGTQNTAPLSNPAPPLPVPLIQDHVPEKPVGCPPLLVPILQPKGTQPFAVCAKQRGISSRVPTPIPILRMAVLLPRPSALPPNVSEKKFGNFFTPPEDDLLKGAVNVYGTDNWEKVARCFEHHTARQCRDRWNNYHENEISRKPDSEKSKEPFLQQKDELPRSKKRGQWTPEEDALLMQKVADIGSHWKRIQPFFPERSCISLKNRWYHHLRERKTLSHPKILEGTPD